MIVQDTGLALAPHAAVPDADRDNGLATVLSTIERIEGLAATPALADKVRRYVEQWPALERNVLLRRLGEPSPGADAWSSLVEALVNHETYFLRDEAQFALLARLLPVSIARAAAEGRYVLRAWSAGCATGEEAYSIALMLAEGLLRQGAAVRTAEGIELLAPWRVEVVGSDLSRRALATASAGRYPVQALSSFRKIAAPRLDFFPEVPGSGGGMRAVRPCLRRLVRFERRNIARDPHLPGSFDVVACRNVLIYLTPEARAATMQALLQALEPGGCLLIGPTDMLPDPKALDAVWGDGAIIYRSNPAAAVPAARLAGGHHGA